MSRYVITFGMGYPGICKGWVEITCSDEGRARLWARRTYGDCWAGFYDADEFLMRVRSADFYPLGCFGSVDVPS